MPVYQIKQHAPNVYSVEHRGKDWPTTFRSLVDAFNAIDAHAESMSERRWVITVQICGR